MIAVECVAEVTPEIASAYARLIPQLSTVRPPTLEELQVVITSGTTLFIARDGTQIVGSLALVLYRIPTGLRARIEDVVVDESARGKGVGEALSRAAVEHARAAGARGVDLTSRPEREAANRLYRRMGFELRDSHVYRYKLEK